LSVNAVSKYYQLVINVLCVPLFVTSLINMLQALLQTKLNVYDQIAIKLPEKENNFFHEFHVRMIYEWNFWFNKTKTCNRERLRHLRYMTNIARFANNNCRQKLRHI